MNTQEDFDRIGSILAKYEADEIAKDCLVTMKNGTVRFSPGFTNSASALYHIYEFRCRDRFEREGECVEGCVHLIKKLGGLEGESRVRCSTLLANRAYYIIFVEEDADCLIGLLRKQADRHNFTVDLGGEKYPSLGGLFCDGSLLPS